MQKTFCSDRQASALFPRWGQRAAALRWLLRVCLGLSIALHIQADNGITPTVDTNATLIAQAWADLNADGRQDCVMALEFPSLEETARQTQDRPRTLLLMLRNEGGTLSPIVSSTTLIPSSNSGGMLGDPFAGLMAETGRFSVTLHGGSNWRWSYVYTFAYDADADDWLLVCVEESFGHLHAEKPKLTRHHFPGTIQRTSLAAFTPENWRATNTKDTP